MLIIPAIDIKDGKVVRLLRGEFDKVKVYSDKPALIARRWEKQGAKRLHVVDLDGAKTGKLKNLLIIKQVIKSVDIPVEVGGGVRTLKDAQALLKAGAGKIIVGTKAALEPELLGALVRKYGDKIIVSIDAKDGFVAVRGWVKATDLKAVHFAQRLESLGLREIVYTDISRDGTMKGPNLPAIKTMLEETEELAVIASGGVSCLADIKALKAFKPRRLSGVIIGKALYEGKVKLSAALKVV
ncbi:MAG: 1-(5-phosphoribosyl)-5-[(5-phosphoribosylamino)methylideneamino]imidazole-4-carboxamide isomerase [Candidatus Omnitrophota bacterium]